MNFQLSAQAEKRAKKHIVAGRSATWAVQDVIESVARKHRSSVWKKFEKLDVTDEPERLARWLTGVLRDEPPHPKVNGLWFGLFEMAATSRRKGGVTLYVSGSRRFGTRASDSEWPCEQDWFPEGRYVNSELLGSMSRLRPKRDYDTAWIIECGVILPATMILIAEVCRRTAPRAILGTAPFRGIGCGFDSGDFHLLGIVRPTGFEPSRPK
jgi:hypothetical protein